jgi:hypothetical protein
LLRSFTLAEIGRAVQASAGAGSSVDFTPSHALTSVRGGVAYDLNRSDPWDLISEGPQAAAGRSTIGQASGFVHATIETLDLATQLWRAQSIAAFNFAADAWSVLYPWRCDTLADGGLIMSNAVGPNSEDPYYPTATYYGANRGWGPSSNGDGGFGYLMHGTLDHHNTDTVASSYDAADGRWRWMEIGYNPAAKTSWMTCALRTDEIAAQVAAGLAGATYGVCAIAKASASGVGDMTSPDPMILGGNRYGTRQGNQTGAIGLPIVVFEGTAALNRWSYRFTSLPVMQAQLERAGG